VGCHTVAKYSSGCFAFYHFVVRMIGDDIFLWTQKLMNIHLNLVHSTKDGKNQEKLKKELLRRNGPGNSLWNCT